MNNESDIYGEGFGSSHSWQRLGTRQTDDSLYKCTQYLCRDCGELFNHMYDHTPNIFLALEKSGCSDKCDNFLKGVL